MSEQYNVGLALAPLQTAGPEASEKGSEAASVLTNLLSLQDKLCYAQHSMTGDFEHLDAALDAPLKQPHHQDSRVVRSYVSAGDTDNDVTSVQRKKGCALADAAHEVPALLLDALDVAHGLHARHVLHRDLRDPLHAGRVAPQVVALRRLQSAPGDGAQAALRGHLVLLLHSMSGTNQHLKKHAEQPVNLHARSLKKASAMAGLTTKTALRQDLVLSLQQRQVRHASR